MIFKKMVKMAWIPLILVGSLVLAQGGPVAEANLEPELSRFAPVANYGNVTGVNIDIPFACQVICGISITVQGKPCEPPTSFYSGIHNPWKTPSNIQEIPAGSGTWVITFGGVDGPCFDRNATDANGNKYFWTGTTFRGVHLGFYIPGANNLYNPGDNYFNFAYAIHCEEGTYYGSGVPGHTTGGGGINVVAGQDVRMADVMVAPASRVQLNDLRPDLVPELPWQPIQLANDVVTAEGLHIPIPQSILQNSSGRIIFAYSMEDPDTGESRGSVTLDFPVQQ